MERIKESNSASLWTDARQEFHAQRHPNVSESFVHFAEADVHQTIHGRFEQIVERYPDNIAIMTPEWSLTYQELNQQANQIAHTIIHKFGATPQQVAFILPNDGSAVAAMLGIVKAGKSYVPLDPNFPKDRLAYMLADSQSTIVLTNSENEALAIELTTEGALINLDGLAVPLLEAPAERENPGVYPDPLSLAYILYTSGSTGLPKGVAFAHRNLLHTKMCLVNSLRISPEDSMTQLHSTSFASSIIDIYGCLTSGATLYPWDVKVRGFVGLADWLRNERVTCFQWIPTPFRHFMDTLESDEQLPDIRLVVMASEPLTSKEMKLHRRHFTKTSLLVNQMGTSETFNYNLYFVGHDTPVDSYIMPAGHSVSEDREILILDDEHQPVAKGDSGEIAIKTEYMSSGYWQKPELTAEKFLSDPDGGGKRIYLTGDLGKILPDGCLIHQGRKDFQVKIRGYRIEINEIEKALNDVIGVRDAVVVAKEAAHGDKELVAYIVPDRAIPGQLLLEGMSATASEGQNGSAAASPTAESQLLSVDAIKSQLEQRLPEYMIPSLFVTLDSFPTTVTGKMDRMRLPEPNQVTTKPIERQAHVAPSTPTEIRLAQMWSNLLGKPSISVQDSFFELGGHSLHAARMFFEIERDLGVRIPLSTLFHAQSITELAQVIDGETPPPSWSSLTPIQTSGTKPPFYIIHAHGGNVLGYFELSQYLEPDQPFYGLQAMGLDGTSIEKRTMDEIAAAYLAEIRTLQPHGPYYLGGYCFGGNMAFAMAQQLKNAGEEVALLTLIESTHKDYPTYPDNKSGFAKTISKLFSRISYEWDSATLEGMSSVGPHIKARLFRSKDIFQIKIEHKLDTLGKKLGRSIPQSQLYIQDRLEQVHDRAYYGYESAPYDGDILLFRAEHQPKGIVPDDTLGWRDYVNGELEIYEISGHSVGIMDEPRVQDLARIINEHMNQAQSQPKGQL